MKINICDTNAIVQKIQAGKIGTLKAHHLLFDKIETEIERLDCELCAEHDARIFTENNSKQLLTIVEKAKELIAWRLRCIKAGDRELDHYEKWLQQAIAEYKEKK